jgi:hypothetical protein
VGAEGAFAESYCHIIYMPTYKKKRRHNKKTYRKRKHGGQNIWISRITDAKGNYLDKRINRTTEGKNPKTFNPYIEPSWNFNIDPNEMKYANSVLFSTLKPNDIKKTDILVRVNNKEEEAQMRLYNELEKDLKNKDDLKKYFKVDDDKTKILLDLIEIWNKRPTNNNESINKAKFPKYFEKNTTSIPQKIDELKDDIYPLITDNIVEYFMDQVTKDKYSSIYDKDNKNTYNNIRFVIMHILNFVYSTVQPAVGPP